jgi:hypothetical protein
VHAAVVYEIKIFRLDPASNPNQYGPPPSATGNAPKRFVLFGLAATLGALALPVDSMIQRSGPEIFIFGGEKPPQCSFGHSRLG